MGWVSLVLAIVFGALFYRERRRRDAPASAVYRSLIEEAPTGTVVFDSDHILFANKRLVDLLGGTSFHQGQELEEIVDAATAEQARETYARMQAVPRAVSIDDFAIVGRSGNKVSCDLTLGPVIFNGKPAVQGFVLPTEEKHQAVIALHRTEERFRRFFEDMPVPMYRTRLDGTIVHANAALARLLGHTDPDELIGVDARTFYSDDRERDRLAAMQRSEGLLEDQISRLVGDDGRDIWVRDSSHTVFEDGEEVFEGALVDVTDGQLATRELEVRERRQQILAHIGQVALRSTDVGEVLDEAVAQLCEVLDVECVAIAQDQEGHGLLVTNAAYQTDSSRRREQVFSYLQRHGPGALDGTEPIALPAIGASPGVDALSGVSISLAGSGGSFGTIAAAGAGLRLADDDLSFLVTTAAMLGSAIERARARVHLQRLMESKDEFVASVSHELRTPLTVVAGLALELEGHWRSFSSAEIAEFISLIADQSREMSDLIEDLLVAARADIGKVPIHAETTDLRACVDQVVATCSLADRARISVAGSEVEGTVDQVRFRQVVRNLITNAIRYGGPRIHIHLENTGDNALVSVFDDGAGIAPQHRDRIFDPYQRAHSSSGVAGSVGLGLTVSRKLAELMGGSIGYRYDGGSFFELQLPR